MKPFLPDLLTVWFIALGDETIPARLQLLLEQRERLLKQRAEIDNTLERLNYKISKYELAAKTGKLSWDEPEQ